MIHGVDTLASALYIKLIKKYVPKHIAVSVLLHTFDRKGIFRKRTGWKAVRAFTKAGYKVIKVVSQWDNNHEFNAERKQQAFKDALILADIAIKNKHIIYHYMCYLEHREKRRVMEPIFRDLRKVLPDNVILINNPLKQGDYVNMPRVLNEIHHSDRPDGIPEDYSFSHDGEDMLNIDLQKSKNRHKAAKVYWAWIPQFNLKKTLTEKILPGNRKPKVIYKQLIQTVLYLLRTQKGKTELGNIFVWKAQSEQHSNAPTALHRDNKPVLISRKKLKHVVVKTRDGKKLKTLKSSGRLDDGRYAYRLNAFGHVISKRAMRLSSSPIIDVVADGKKIGSIHAAFRENEYK